MRSSTTSDPITKNPVIRPQIGDTIIGISTFGHNPDRWPALSTVLHTITDQSLLAEASVAPHRPPIRAWLELEGRPSHQVKRFQKMAASKAQTSVRRFTALVSTNPAPTVVATAVPNMAPIRLQHAAMAMAWRGLRTRVETTVAIALAVS